MKKQILTIVVLALTILTVAYAYRTDDRQPRSYILRQNIVRNGLIAGTITTYFSRTGDWRTSRTFNNGAVDDYGLISGRGAYQYRQKDDALYLLPHIPAVPKVLALSAEDLARMPQSMGKVELKGMETYLIRNLIDNNPGVIAAEFNYVPGLLHPVQSVYYGADGKTVHNTEEFVSLEFREPLREELMQRYEGKPTRVAADPHQR